MQDRFPDTDKGIICPVRGKQGLTNSQYKAQMSRPDSFWHCPIVPCDEVVQWDDDRYEADAVTEVETKKSIEFTDIELDVLVALMGVGISVMSESTPVNSVLLLQLLPGSEKIAREVFERLGKTLDPESWEKAERLDDSHSRRN